jgi:hypothetical protein
MGISESTSRERLSRLEERLGAANLGQAVWRLRRELEHEARPTNGRGHEPAHPVAARHCLDCGAVGIIIAMYRQGLVR